MSTVMPQEIEVWYLLPALRRELVKVFAKEHKLSQKESAKILGITEAAVSQYLNEKRGTEYQFTQTEQLIIKKTAEQMILDKTQVMKQMYALCVAFRGSKTICDIHRKHDQSVSSNCDICCKTKE